MVVAAVEVAAAAAAEEEKKEEEGEEMPIDSVIEAGAHYNGCCSHKSSYC